MVGVTITCPPQGALFMMTVQFLLIVMKLFWFALMILKTKLYFIPNWKNVGLRGVDKIVRSPVNGPEELRTSAVLLLASVVAVALKLQRVVYPGDVAPITFATIKLKCVLSIGVTVSMFTNAASASKITHLFGVVKDLVSPNCSQLATHVFA